jgi:hypothetical protein
MAGGRILVGGEIYQDIKYLEKFLVHVEGTLNPSIPLIEIGKDIMPTPRGWEGNYAYL